MEKRILQLPRIRLKPSERLLLDEDFKTSFQPTFSDFIRQRLLDKKISRSQELRYKALLNVGNLRRELNAIGNNVNQIAKRLNTEQEIFITGTERTTLMHLDHLLTQIKSTLDEM